MKKFLALLATPIAGLLIAIAAPVAVNIADAHTPQVVPSCTGLSITLSNYEGSASNNLVIVGIDNQPPGGVFFASSFSHIYAWSQTAVHSYSVQIDADRNSGPPTQYDATFSGTWQPCQVPPSTTSTPATTSTAPTTTVPTSTTVVGTTTTTTLGSTPTTVAVSLCVYDVTLPADSPLCVAPSTIDPLPTVPVQLLHNSDVLPRTGSRTENDLLFAFGLVLLGSATALIARRRSA